MADNRLSRLAESRMNMTPEERAKSYQPKMFDVPVSEQLVRYGDNAKHLMSTDDRYAELISNAKQSMGIR